MARSTETVRTTLKAYDREHPDRAIFPPSLAPLDEAAKGQIYRLYRRGVSAEVLAGQFGKTRSSIYRVINEMRAPADPRRQARVHAAPELRRPRGRRDDPRPDARAGRRQGAEADEGPQGAPPLPGEPLRGPAAGPRAGDAPVPQDELPEVSGQQAPRAGRPRPRQDRRTSTRSNGSRKRRWRSRTRSSAPTSAWSSRSPSGTSARRTTSSSWSATATCR